MLSETDNKQSMTTITDKEKQRRIELVREALTRNPELTKSHFQKAYGFS